MSEEALPTHLAITPLFFVHTSYSFCATRRAIIVLNINSNTFHQLIRGKSSGLTSKEEEEEEARSQHLVQA
jgi:hypothetical protein